MFFAGVVAASVAGLVVVKGSRVFLCRSCGLVTGAVGRVGLLGLKARSQKGHCTT